MVTKVVIKDNKKSPLHYLADLPNFANGKEFVFGAGVNVIVGENGCGKTTLMNLIKTYLCVDYDECGRGQFNNIINKLFRTLDTKSMLDGVDVYADYTKNTFRLVHVHERHNKEINTAAEFGAFYEQNHASTGEGVLIAIQYLFGNMFGGKSSLTFDYDKQFKEVYPKYVEYVNAHRVQCDDEWTILMDEPDRNLDIKHIDELKGILSFHKEHTQIIAVVHNPLLICALSKVSSVHFIEMTEGYVSKVVRQVEKILK